MENGDLLAALEGRIRELAGLHEISQAFASLTRLEDTFGQLVEHIASLLDAERCVILLPDEREQYLVAQAPAFGLTGDQVRTMRIPIDEESAAARVWTSGNAYLTNDAQSDPRNLHRWARAFGDRCMAILPLRVEGKNVGLLRASNKRSGRFTDNDMRLLAIFATQAAVVLRNAMLFRELADQRARLRAIFDHASDGIMIFDRDGVVIDLNHAMEAISGWAAPEAIGRECWDVCPPAEERSPGFRELAAMMASRGFLPTGQPHLEMAMRTHDGRQRDLGVSISFLESPEGASYCVAIIRDISRAKELERVKSQFISTVSHELRTPLASIKASIGLLLTSMPNATAEPLMRLLHNISRSTRRLESLVSDLLDLARLQSGRVSLRRQWLDLREVVNAVAATMRPMIEEKGQELTVRQPHEPCHVLGDRQRLEQVLLNLLSNAHKYTDKGGRISVQVGYPEAFAEMSARGFSSGAPICPESKRPEWWIAVADTGFGIPAKEQEYVFERFYRVEGQDTQRTAGTGLGLPIARALVELHGGRIWLASEPGRGSTFYVALMEGRADEDIGG